MVLLHAIVGSLFRNYWLAIPHMWLYSFAILNGVSKASFLYSPTYLSKFFIINKSSFIRFDSSSQTKLSLIARAIRESTSVISFIVLKILLIVNQTRLFFRFYRLMLVTIFSTEQKRAFPWSFSEFML